jgi:hypothetical protein
MPASPPTNSTWAKGKVEAAVSDREGGVHETLYHFHKPETEAQDNDWLMRYLLRYNDQPHRHEDQSRMQRLADPFAG